MKYQISKVAIIATLAFVGVAFTGTQQANASDCGKSPAEPSTCDNFCPDGRLSSSGPLSGIPDDKPVCKDFNGDCTFHYVDYSTRYYNCVDTQGFKLKPDTCYDKVIDHTGEFCFKNPPGTGK